MTQFCQMFHLIMLKQKEKRKRNLKRKKEGKNERKKERKKKKKKERKKERKQNDRKGFFGESRHSENGNETTEEKSRRRMGKNKYKNCKVMSLGIPSQGNRTRTWIARS